MERPTSKLFLLSDKWQIDSIRDEADTIDIRYGVYRQAQDPRGYVVFFNGRTEWIEKYDYLAEDLQLPPDVGFVTMDHRGQGGSGGARSFVESYDLFASDCRRVVETATSGKPYVLVGHSMGGLIALYGTMTHQLNPRAMVLCSPLLGMPDDPVPRKFAKPVSRLLSTVRLGPLSTGAGYHSYDRFENNRLTYNYERYRRMQESPYRATGVTFGWVNATFAAIAKVFQPAEVAKLNVPTLVMGGVEESVVDPEAFGKWVRLASEQTRVDTNLRLLNGARHELLSEAPEVYQQALAEIRAWIKPALITQ